MGGFVARLAGVAMALLVSTVMSGCGGSKGSPRPVIGVSMAHFDDNFLTILRMAMAEHAATFPEFDLQFVDAQGDVGRQLEPDSEFRRTGRGGDYRQCRRHVGDAGDDEGRARRRRAAGVRESTARRGDAAERRRVRRIRRSSRRHAGDGGARAADEPPRQCRHHGGRARVQRRAASHESGRGCRGEVSRHESGRKAGRQFSARARARSDEQLADRGPGDRCGRREQR